VSAIIYYSRTRICWTDPGEGESRIGWQEDPLAFEERQTYPFMDRATGLWMGEPANFFRMVGERGSHVDSVNPKGGDTLKL
ncbi:hypothetical protein, partial [Cupriavidus basilensis]|uniref:hypothetical protein n=1 Tax=Cupriavidus basilensis TaxID=68895 RepID=UPI0023E7A21D